MERILPIFSSWLLYVLGVIAAYNHQLMGVGILFIFFFVADFFTGFLASMKQGKRFQSSKARWSFAKSLCYLGSFAAIVFIGACLDNFSLFMKFLNVAVFTATWMESVSNLENLTILFPHNRFLKFLHYILAVEFVKKIPRLSDFLKEEKNKDNDQCIS